MSIHELSALVWDTVAEGREISPDSAELRKAAYRAVGVKGDDPLTATGHTLGYAVMEWLQGMAPFDKVRSASRAHEAARINRLKG
jgi:high-affinity K+ transport system ATPase subunit B